MAKNGVDLISRVDTILLGRVTYELMANYWPSASPPEDDPVIIEKMNNLQKIVFSNTLEVADWNNTRVVKEVDADEIMRMKISQVRIL